MDKDVSLINIEQFKKDHGIVEETTVAKEDIIEEEELAWEKHTKE